MLWVSLFMSCCFFLPLVLIFEGILYMMVITCESTINGTDERVLVPPRHRGQICIWLRCRDGIYLLEGPGFSVTLLRSTPSDSVIRFWNRDIPVPWYASWAVIELWLWSMLQLWQTDFFSQDEGTNNPTGFILLRCWNGLTCGDMKNSIIRNWLA